MQTEGISRQETPREKIFKTKNMQTEDVQYGGRRFLRQRKKHKEGFQGGIYQEKQHKSRKKTECTEYKKKA